MTTRIALILSEMLISCGLSLAQQAGQVRPIPTVGAVLAPRPVPDDSLTRFDLDFPGGTPEQLVRAIEKASGKLPNAIIPTEFADLQLPPLKMKSVTVPALFQALALASQKSELEPYSDNRTPGVFTTAYAQVQSNYGFQTQGPPGDDSVWYFFVNRPRNPGVPKACRFYNLAPYLETYKVEDVTTAIQTGWKMLGEVSPPTITYHKDTKLLIAVGGADKLQLIENVLSQLSREKPAPAKSGESAKPVAK